MDKYLKGTRNREGHLHRRQVLTPKQENARRAKAWKRIRRSIIIINGLKGCLVVAHMWSHDTIMVMMMMYSVRSFVGALLFIDQHLQTIVFSFCRTRRFSGCHKFIESVTLLTSESLTRCWLKVLRLWLCMINKTLLVQRIWRLLNHQENLDF